MNQGLGRAVEHQADAHAGGEQHGEPGDVAVFRPVLGQLEAYVTEAAEGHKKAEQHEDVHRQQVAPAEVLRQAGEQRFGKGAEVLWGLVVSCHDRQGDGDGDQIDGVVLLPGMPVAVVRHGLQLLSAGG